ncbi:hypothetical protein CR513_57883, partial [Mucuna pruriens]
MVGTECFSTPTVMNSTCGAGNVTNIAGLNSYVTGSPLSALVILFMSDLADKVAAKGGYRVVCPDVFNGDPFDRNNTTRPVAVWLKDHAPEKGFETVKPVIEALKKEGATAIGAAGFCWGARTVTDLGKAKSIQVSVLLHPTYVKVDDVRGVKVPIALLVGQNDSVTPPKLMEQFKQVLDAKPEMVGMSWN